MSIGIAIRRIRSALDLSLAEMGELIGVPTPSLSGVEREDRPLPDLAMRKLLMQMRVSEEELELIGVRNAALIAEQKSDGSSVYLAVRQQCAARQVLRLKLK